MEGQHKHLKQSIDGKLKVWTIVALIASVAGDLAAPFGHFVLYFLIAAFVLTVAGILLWRSGRGFGYSLALNAGVGFAIFLVMLIGQWSSPSTPGVPQRGVIATNVTFISNIQTNVLPLSPEVRNLFILQDGLKSPDPTERVKAARRALLSDDDEERRKAIEIVFASGDEHLRQIAILHALKMREHQTLPISVAPAQAQTALSQALIGASIYLSRVDEPTSSFEGTLSCRSCGFRIYGTANRKLILINSLIDIGKQRLPVSIELHATDDLELEGPVMCAGCESARIVIPLL